MVASFSPLLFDLDGTLVDSGLDIALSVNHTLRQLGFVELDPGRVMRMVGDGVRRLMERALGEGPRPEDLQRAIEIFRRHYRQHALDHTRVYPGLAELLHRLRPTPLGVVTNKPVEFARQVLAGLGLLDLVDALVGGDETEKLKPDPAPLLLACRRLGLAPAGGLMVGDFANDVLAGRAAGMKTCGVTWGFAGSESVVTARPDFICRDAEELARLLLAKV